MDERLQTLVDMKVPALDIIHGELKNLMYQAEQEYAEAQRIEEENDYDDAMESMERRYWEGQVDALTHLYQLTYQLSFAEAERDNK
jgi:DNA-binding NtrC family response regulator